MKSKIIALLLFAAFCTASAVSCGTVENVSESSAIVKTDESSAADESLEPVTSGTLTSAATTTATAVTTSTTTADSEPATQKVISAGNGYVADPGTAPEPDDTPAEDPVSTPEPQTEPPTDPPTDPPAGSFSNDDMYFNGSTVLTDASNLISLLGSPTSTETAPSCLSNGADMKIYHYADLDVSVYISGESEVLYDITITGSMYSTSKGITVGSSYSDVVAAYGEGQDVGGGIYCYGSGATGLYIYTSGGIVTSISYYGEV